MTWQLVLIVILMMVVVLLLVILLRKKKHDEEPFSDHPLMDRASEERGSDDLQTNDPQANDPAVRDQPAHDHVADDQPVLDPQRETSEHSDLSDELSDEPFHQRYLHDYKRPDDQQQQLDLESMPSLELPALEPALEPALDPTDDAPHTPELSLQQESTPLAEAVVQLLNQIEERLGQCDFDQAEALLQQVTEQWPDSLRALALKAQLLYETDRLGEMNDLIHTISATSDEQRWEQFCYFLPSQVWNACFGNGASSTSPQKPDQA